MNDLCLFVSDLHGKVNRYEKLFNYIEQQKPGYVFLGGDLLPSSILHSFRAGVNMPDFITDFLADNFAKLKDSMKEQYPKIFIILGNDDPRIKEEELLKYDHDLWYYLHGRIIQTELAPVIGYSFVPPTPFLLKDWEKYDMDKEIRPGCLHPSDGFFTYRNKDTEPDTIYDDLEKFTSGIDLSRAICVFHSPPYNCNLDKAALDGVTVDGNPIDAHVGSEAIKQFIEMRKPKVTLHGHIHESSRLTGSWKEISGKTVSMTAAFEGPGQAVIRFNYSDPENAQRIVI
jgi:uncharacterized protein